LSADITGSYDPERPLSIGIITHGYRAKMESKGLSVCLPSI